MHGVQVRDHIMIAHSFTGEFFGPAQAMHGATFVVDACFMAKTLFGDTNVVIDIGAAHDALKAVLQPINYQNLDELPQFDGENTTTEYLTKYVWDHLAKIAKEDGLGRPGSELDSIRVTISESHVALAWYEAPLS